jgi:hypothetical protein
MKTLRAILSALICLALMVALCACDHKELCMDHDPHTPTYSLHLNFTYDQIWHEDYSFYNDPDVDIDGGWVVEATEYYDRELPELIPQEPEGIRCLLFDDDGERHTYNFSPYEGNLQMNRGDHQLLFYNNDSEYIVFADDPEATAITLSTRTRSRSSYKGSPFVGSTSRAENTVAPPDMLYFGYIDDYAATSLSATPDTMTVEMRPLVCTYVVRCNFARGGEYVVLARGALAGMAGSVKLYNGETMADDVATMLFDCSLTTDYAQATVNTFGVPGYQLQSRGAQLSADGSDGNTYGLNLELRLVNGTILSFDYDVTDQVALQPQGGVIVVDGIEIDKPEEVSSGSGSGSGFDVRVDGWGEYQDYTLPIGN